VQEELLSLFAARRGHFRFESGHHGDLWLEIPAAYVHTNLLRPYTSKLARLLAAHQVEAICGPLVEGALLAQMVAEEMRVEFYFAEQSTRAGADGLYPVGYRIPDALRGAIRGKRTAIVDDVINAGSATRGACEDLETCGAGPSRHRRAPCSRVASFRVCGEQRRTARDARASSSQRAMGAFIMSALRIRRTPGTSLDNGESNRWLFRA
jgi:orotate phosphoribosyltransferase